MTKVRSTLSNHHPGYDHPGYDYRRYDHRRYPHIRYQHCRYPLLHQSEYTKSFKKIISVLVSVQQVMVLTLGALI
jgi:hypothetical protein